MEHLDSKNFNVLNVALKTILICFVLLY